MASSVHRKKLRRWEVPNDARFLTFSCYHRLQLFNNSRIKDAYVDEIVRAREQHRFRLLAWVIMPEHVHLLLVARPTTAVGGGTVARIAWRLKKPFADRVLARWTQLNAKILSRVTLRDGSRRFWQTGGGHDRNIRDDEEYWAKVNYIHENPCTRGLVSHPLEWPWSSARWYAGIREGQIELDV